MDELTLATGCLPQPPETRVGSVCREYTGAMIERPQWFTTTAMSRYVPRGKCQRSIPACNWYASVKALQTKYALQTGGKYPELSYIAGYLEDTNGSFRVGTMPLEAIRMIAERGVPPVVDGLPEWYTTNRRIPEQAQQDRAWFKADEWEQVTTGPGVVSAILNNDPVNLAFDWYDSDANPGPTGHLPVRGRGGVGGHSVLGCGVVLGYDKSPSGVGILFNNHHGDSVTPTSKDERGRTLQYPVWGDDGFGVIPLERVVAGIPVYGCWALRSVTVRDEDLNVPTPKFGG